MFFNKEIKIRLDNLEKQIIDRLDSIEKQIKKIGNAKKYIHENNKDENMDISVSQIIDEWVNGEKRGEL